MGLRPDRQLGNWQQQNLALAMGLELLARQLEMEWRPGLKRWPVLE